MFELFGYFTDLGYTGGCKMWYKIAGLSPPEGIEEIIDDRVCQDMLDYNKTEDHIDIYYVSLGPPLKVVGMDDAHCELNQEEGEELSDDVHVYFHGESDDMYVYFIGSDEEDNNAGDDENEDAGDKDGSVEHEDDGKLTDVDDSSEEDCDIHKLTQKLINDLKSKELDEDTSDSEYKMSDEEDDTESDSEGDISDVYDDLEGSDDDIFPNFGQTDGLGEDGVASVGAAGTGEGHGGSG